MSSVSSPSLDLDSLLHRLNSTSSSDDENENDHFSRRTLDDILNSTSPPSSPPHRLHSLSISPSPNPTLYKQNLIQRFKSADFSPSINKKKQNPFKEGERRIVSKPGAALAAAAAASRSLPSSHAARIKSSRSSVSVSTSVSVEADVDERECSREVAGGDHDHDEVDGVRTEVSVSKSLEDEGKRESGVCSETIRIDDEVLLEDGNNDVKSEFVSKEDDKKGEFVLEEGESKEEVDIDDSKKSDLVVGECDDDNDNDRKSELVVKEDDLSLISEDYDDDINNVEEIVENRIEEEEESEGDEARAEEKEEEEEEGEEEGSVVKKEKEKKALEVAEEMEKRQASTGQDWEEGAAAQPMMLEGVRKASIAIGYFETSGDNAITRAFQGQGFRRDYGIPQVVAVHLNYVAVGMSKGVVVVVPSKYSPHRPDTMDSKMLMLGAQGERSIVPVTSVCFNQQGDLLLAGYGDGHVTLWNIPRGTVAKVISGEHKAPIVHLFFLGQDSQLTRQFIVVSGDCKGLVLQHEFSVMPLIGFKITTKCLLDGQKTGIVLCASPLLPEVLNGATSGTPQGNPTSSSNSLTGVMGGVVGGAASWKLFSEGPSLSEEGAVIFVTHQTALVVRLSPSLEVYASIPKPEGVREGSIPYTAWKCTVQPRDSSTGNSDPEALEKISLLALAWDRKVQVATLVKSDLKVCAKWTLDSAAIGLAWLDDQMLVVLTSSGQLCLFTREGTLVHQTSHGIDEFGGDDLFAYHSYFNNSFGNPERAYHNTIAIRGASVYILGPMHVVVARLLPWKERIQTLRKGGDWMGALNMALTLYDGQAHGIIDLPRNLSSVREAMIPYMVELISLYVDESFSYILIACSSHIDKVEEGDGSSSANNSANSEIKEQFTHVGGVAVEFCVHIKRTDVLFEGVFSKFIAAQQKDTFLELLERYILRDMLGSLPPEIMQALVEHYNSKGWLQRVEQCILHMDISSLDFNQVVRLCRENGLYGALIYLFNKGLDDFKTPLEELLSVLRNREKNTTDAAAVGYRMLIYLKYCFLGLAFPPGHGSVPSERVGSLRMELLNFLLEDSGAPRSHGAGSLTSTGAHLNLHYLLELDTEATLDVLRLAFLNDDVIQNVLVSEDPDVMVQTTVDALVLVLDIDISQSVRSVDKDDASQPVWPSKGDIGHLIEFIASYVASRRANVSSTVLSQILEFLTTENYQLPDGRENYNGSKKLRENKVLTLLNAVPQTEWNASYVMHLCEKVQFYQVCGLIHSMRHQYQAALDSYMKDVDGPWHAFCFIDSILLRLSESEYVPFRSAVISRIPELVILSRECTLILVVDHFSKESGHILSVLRSNPKSLFLYLKTIVEVHLSGTLNFSWIGAYDRVGPWGRRMEDGQDEFELYLQKISESPKTLRNNPVEVTDDMVELYLELLCQNEPDSVLKFLNTFENYRVDRCLQLCQKYGIVDAAAFLLERVGDVGSALLLTLTGINDRFVMLDKAVGGMVSEMSRSKSSRGKSVNIDHSAAASGLKEAKDIMKILQACIGLCQRNTLRLNPEESETLWFHLLDSFCKPLVLSDEKTEENDEEIIAVAWRIRSQKYAAVLKKLFSKFVKEIVEGMIGYVRLPSIMAKLLADNGSQEFGDFKLTILGMLGTYGFERRILDTAKSLIEDDTFHTMTTLRKGASKAYAPRSLVCCICNLSFNGSSSSSGMRVFNCGHATHLQCEVQENGSSSLSSTGGCPICVHKKRTQKSKGKVVEQGLVSTFSSGSRRAQGTTTLHPHEFDAFDSSVGSHQVSRFEILNKLQKNQRLIPSETMPQLRLAPPAVYHEKVNKRIHFSAGSSSDGFMGTERPSRNRQLKDLKVKASSIRFPLKSTIFGKEKTRVQ